MSQVFGMTGLLLVPVGGLWVAAGYWNRLAAQQHRIAAAALIVATVVWLTVLLGAIATSGPVLGLAGLVLWIYVVSRLLPRLRRLRSAPSHGPRAAGFYALIVPVAVALVQMAVLAPAIESSRNRAIRNSAPLIAEIEQYRAANGRYPESLLSVWGDHVPGVTGIREYRYEPSGDAFNLLFEQSALHFGTREFVIYNPRDQQTMTSHRLDRLQLSPSQLALEHTRGHNAVHDAAQPHWKYFWFD